MKYTIIIFCGLLLTGNVISAHTYDHLKIEELKLLVREQEQKLEHYKHELSKEKVYTAFKELLKSLGF
jgi:nucleoside diphosphate kinase